MRLRTALLLLAAIAGCARFAAPAPAPLPAEVAGADHVGVQVSGVVTDRWGYRVADAWVTVRVGSPLESEQDDPACRDATHLPTRTRTSPLGEFAVLVDAGARPPFRACLEIETLPPRAYGLREGLTVVPSASFVVAAQQAAHAREVHVVVR